MRVPRHLSPCCDGERARRGRPSIRAARAIVLAIAGVLALPALTAQRCAGAENASSEAVFAEISSRRALRRPVALAEILSRRLLCAANQRSGSVSLIDTRSFEIVAEHAVAERLSDLVVVPGSDDLLVLDEAADRLLRLGWREERLSAVAQIEVARAPVTVRAFAGGERCAVASLWGRSISVIDLTGRASDSLRLLGKVDLPFSPREQILLERDEKLVVAEAFGENLALIDTAVPRLISVRRLPGHNTRGLALSADATRLYVSHPVLNPLSPTNANDVHWGMVIANLLRSLSVSAVVDPAGDPLEGAWYSRFRDGGNAAGDPADVAVDAGGRVVVALGGVAEIAIADGPDLEFRRVAVGRRPEAVLFSAAGDRVFVANRLDDSISVVDPEGDAATLTVPLGPQPPWTPADRGEALFYDARLSLDSWYSCHSCHTDGHTNGLLNDNLGDGSFGAPKRIPSLLGVAHTGPWAWNGAMESLEEQVQRSVRTTLHGLPLSAGDVRDLVTFLRSLPGPPRMLDGDGHLRTRGREVFEERECGDCHVPPAFTSERAHDVGLSDAAGNRRFNPPSLRGVAWRRAFFHDGSESELEGVFTRHAHGLDEPLAAEDLAALVAYLRSL